MNTTPPKPSLMLYLAQTTTSALILLIFSTYVWILQLNYDESTEGYKRALFFALMIFGGGFSYDCAKKILFLKQNVFIKFSKSLLESFVQLLAITLLGLASITFTNMSHIIIGQALYIATLSWTLLALNSLAKAIKTASNG